MPPNQKTYEQRRQEFLLRRDMILVGVGIAGLIGMSVAILFTEIKSEAIALALITAFSSLCMGPVFLRADEKRRNGP